MLSESNGSRGGRDFQWIAADTPKAFASESYVGRARDSAGRCPCPVLLLYKGV